MRSLREKRTWELSELPKDGRIVGCKWVFKRKLNPETEAAQFKARLVAQGFTQKFGVDYDEVFAPVVRPVTICTLLAVAGKEKLNVYH